MADLSITVASVKPGTGAVLETGTAGETITAGMSIALSAGKLVKYDADSATAAIRTLRGVALHAALVDQPLSIQKKGQIAIGATVAVGAGYYGSATAGGICPVADLATGMYPGFLGFAVTAAIIDLNIVNAGVARP